MIYTIKIVKRELKSRITIVFWLTNLSVISSNVLLSYYPSNESSLQYQLWQEEIEEVDLNKYRFIRKTRQ